MILQQIYSVNYLPNVSRSSFAVDSARMRSEILARKRNVK